MTREDYINMLKTGVFQVKFKKLNGEDRVLNGTLLNEYLPEISNDKNSDRHESETSVSVWDVDKGGWRAFRPESVESFNVRSWPGSSTKSQFIQD